jgi:alkyldihydroxyacetonephosphate synthase
VYDGVRSALLAALGAETVVGCHVSHLYPTGASLYFTVIAAADTGREVEQWQHAKREVNDAIVAAGGTITHHHAVGRDHLPWYSRQRPEPFARAFAAAKAAVDPAGVLNPGVLLPVP